MVSAVNAATRSAQPAGRAATAGAPRVSALGSNGPTVREYLAAIAVAHFATPAPPSPPGVGVPTAALLRLRAKAR